MKRRRWKLPVEVLASLGPRIREIRQRAGYRSPGELSNAIKERGGNISRQYIRCIEIGEQVPSLRKLTMILDACGVTAREFLGIDLTARDDVGILSARLRQAREAAGYETTAQLWKAIRDRGGNVARQYLYRLDWGKQTASLHKLSVILDACGMNVSDFLGTDLILGPPGDSNIGERRLLTMLTKVRAASPTLARVLEFMIIRAFNDVCKEARQQKLVNRI